MKKWTYTWLIISILVALEYFFLKQKPKYSILLFLQSKKIISESHIITTLPGRIVSLWLGWVGLGTMIIMNLYSMRKRMSFMQNMGRVSDWLNFHIFCGLLGPTLILFHCDFKVRGIVSISFWSMMVSFSSGIIGRYFFVQLSKNKVDLENEAEKKVKQIEALIEKYKVKVSQSDLNFAFQQSLQYVGVSESPGVLSVLMNSFIGDLKLAFSPMKLPTFLPEGMGIFYTDYALTKRRAVYLESFQRLMGYWHTFHFPFAIFMYVVAFVHVVAALLLGV